MPTPSYDPRDIATIASPYAAYRALQERAPVYFCDALGGYMLTRYRDVKWALTDASLSADRMTPFTNRLRDTGDGAVEVGRVLGRFMNFTDPPSHTRLRGLVGRAFVPSAAEAQRARISAIVDELLDAVDPAGFDVIESLARPLPIRVISELLGTPLEDAPRLARWSDDLAALIGGAFGAGNKIARAHAALVEMVPYFHQLLERRRVDPRDDLISAWAHANAADDALTDDEVAATSILVLAAGHETTTNLIGNAVLCLLQSPEQYERLDRERALVPSAVEEVARYECPVQNQGRVARETTILHGVTIPAGALVHCFTGAANRDPEVFRDPDAFDIARDDNRHLAFGHGLHFCIGAFLARLETRLALDALLDRFGTRLTLAAPVRWLANVTFRGVEALRVRA